MKKQLHKNYQKPKIQVNKVKTNLLSFNYRSPEGDLLVNYFAQGTTIYIPIIIKSP